MAEEVTVSTKIMKTQVKNLQRLQEEWMNEKRKEGKPVCMPCIYNDFHAGDLKESDHYREMLVMRKTAVGKPDITEVFEESKRSPYYGKTIAYDAKYVCPTGHLITVSYDPAEYNAIFNKAVKAKA